MLPFKSSIPLTKTVAVFLGWYDHRILAGFARFAKEKRWAVMFDYALVHQWSDAPLKVDGIICVIGPDHDAARLIKKMGIPTVVLTNSDEGLMRDYSRVDFDNAACGLMAAEYFLGLGFQNFLAIGKKGRTFFRERIQGFVDGVQAKGHKVEVAWIGESLSRTSLDQPIEKALARVPKPVAVFAPSDVTSVHVIRCAMNLGFYVPDEVAVLGTDNQEMICEHALVPLSSIRANLTRLGYEGAKMLDHVMQSKNRKALRKLVSPAGVVVRQSTNTVAVPNLKVAYAMRYIWENLHRVLGVQEVAAHVDLSKSKLGQLFRTHLHRSIGEEITRARIEKAKGLLALDKMPAKQVAIACGFSSANYFNNIFRKATGATPIKFRQAAKAKTLALP